MYECAVDRDGNWAVGEANGPVLRSSKLLPRLDRQPQSYDLSEKELDQAAKRARQIARSYSAGLC